MRKCMRCCCIVLLVGLLHRVASIETVLAVPAQQYCADADASVDFHLKACVSIDRSVRREPSFAPCPSGTQLRGRDCIGGMRVPPELGCPETYNINSAQKCVRADAYVPPAVVCPECFRLTRTVESKTVLCTQHKYVDPVYSQPGEEGCSDPAECAVEVDCPDGYRLRRRRDHGMSGAGGSWTCVSRVVVPPDSRHTCLSSFSWSPTLAGCLQLSQIDPKPQCPWPNAAVDTRGDPGTPRFWYDAESGMCLSHYVPAETPQCSPGWALENPYHPYCYRKRFAPFLYDCGNAEGFTFKWDNETDLAMCEYRFPSERFEDISASYQSRRDVLNRGWLRLSRPTSYQVAEAYARSQEETEAWQQLPGPPRRLDEGDDDIDLDTFLDTVRNDVVLGQASRGSSPPTSSHEGAVEFRLQKRERNRGGAHQRHALLPSWSPTRGTVTSRFDQRNPFYFAHRTHV